MSRFVFDSLIVALLLLVCISLISTDGTDSKQDEMNTIIQDFENDVSNGTVVEDGYGLEDPIVSYQGNGVSNITYTIGSFIVKGANFGVDMVIKVIQMVIG